MSDDFINQPTAYQEQNATNSDGYGRVWWMNGEPRDGTPGRFWLNPDAMADLGIAFEKPWKVIEHTFSDGNKKQIAVAAALHVAPICWRQQTYIRNDTGGVAGWVTTRSRGKLEAGQSVYFEMLCILEGLNTPVVFSTKQVKTSMAWLADILPDYRKLRDVIKAARNGQAVPPWWFWLAIRSEIGTDKKPVYEKTQGRAVTPPKWIKPADLDNRDTWKAMYVGAEIADWGEQAYTHGGLEWAQRLISETYSATEPQAASNGRNVPQEISEADIPF